MINFKISDLFEGLITVVKPTGKPIPLNIGEIVKGEVLDILPAGGVTLKIKDSFITARTDIPLQKNSEVMLKVLGTPSSPNELRLQFLGPAEKDQPTTQAFKGEALNKFLQEFSGAVAERLTSEKIEGLLKALPSDIGAMPKEIRLQLQTILQESLTSTGQNIQSRLDTLFRDLPTALKNQPVLQGLRLEVTVSVDKVVSEGLRGLLRDTGVALESKLKAVAELLLQNPKGAVDGLEVSPALTGKRASPGDIEQLLPAADRESIENDLKANLFKLKETLAEQYAGVSQKDVAVLKNVSSAVDSILKDIGTFQLLSKTTESFYTFLPVSWQQLKDGDIAFKQNKGGSSASSFSCRLNLDLDNLGKLVIMVLIHNNEFFVSFRPDNENFKSLLASQVEHLDKQFNGKGLNLKSVRVLDKDDTSLEQLENLDQFRQIVSIKA
jgi:flagellar hook-length control protein FliK